MKNHKMDSKTTVEIIVVRKFKKKIKKTNWFFFLLSVGQLAVVLTMFANPYKVTTCILGEKQCCKCFQPTLEGYE